MIGKAIALVQVPNQRLFGPAAAAKYLGICTDTIYTIDPKDLPVFSFMGRRSYRLEDLDHFVESLPTWHDAHRQKPKSANSERTIHAV